MTDEPTTGRSPEPVDRPQDTAPDAPVARPMPGRGPDGSYEVADTASEDVHGFAAGRTPTAGQSSYGATDDSGYGTATYRDFAGRPFGDQPPAGPYPGQPYAGQYGSYGGQPQQGQYPGGPYGGPYGQPYAGQYGSYSGQPQQGPYAGAPYGGPYGQPYAGQHQLGSAQHPYWGAPANYWAPPAAGSEVRAGGAATRRRRRIMAGSVAVGAAVALTLGAVVVGVEQLNRNSSQQTAATTPSTQTNPNAQGGTGSGSSGGQFNFGNPYGSGGTGGTGSSGSTGSGGTTGTATAAESVGVVDINTVLDYGTGKAAGTGMVLTSNGTILTNNHVIDGSTSVSVVVVSTGKTYRATVVGTDKTDDIAVLQLTNASGLATAKFGNSSSVVVGDKVTAVGNAGGTGGTPSSASGSVTALGQSITASDSDGSNAEKLTGMIQTDADVQAGDSGGPLYNSKGEIIGIDTAASSSQAAQATGFAIPIATAMTIANQIRSGTETSVIHIGYPAFLGVQLDPNAQGSGAGAVIAGVVPGSAAASAGLAAGDTITAVNGTAITSASTLSSALASKAPGAKVTITWTDSAGASHRASLTLGSGPAD